jgi:hypothetical protein
MCRSIRVLHNFDPPTTSEEMAAAALQYVRKVSGLHHPSHHDEAAFDAAVRTVTAATEKLLASLNAGGKTPRTREGEREKARARWKQREAKMAAAAPATAPPPAPARRGARPGPRR